MCRPSRTFAAFAIAALVGAGTAAAASAPTASTGPVTAVGPTTATVSGSVNPNGTATTWHVEYGTTTSYGTPTAGLSAGSGTASVAVSQTLTGLKPGTSYHYRIVATSTAGTGHGADGLLTTSAAPQVVTGTATSVTTSSATLNGTVNPSSRATSWYFDYGTSTSYGKQTAK
jgi:phosphodiesterase/alkaline phosphatase D-like protein